MLNFKRIRLLVFSFAAFLVLSTPLVSQAVIEQQLDFGEINDEVRELQTFLAQYPSIYPEGLVTGYFGPLTQAAVQRFQCEYDIVCSGTPFTTGYGRVGPITMDAINDIMEGGTGGPEIDIAAPIMSTDTISVSTSTATISWTTTEDARSRVMYADHFPFLYATASSSPDSSIDQSSTVIITGLQPNTTYYYTRESVDLYDNVMWTVPSRNFTTAPQ